jgi:hypothetical protein
MAFLLYYLSRQVGVSLGNNTPELLNPHQRPSNQNRQVDAKRRFWVCLCQGYCCDPLSALILLGSSVIIPQISLPIQESSPLPEVGFHFWGLLPFLEELIMPTAADPLNAVVSDYFPFMTLACG